MWLVIFNPLSVLEELFYIEYDRMIFVQLQPMSALKSLKKLDKAHLVGLHDQNKSGFLKGRLFSIQSKLFEYFLSCSDWLDKCRLSKSRFCFDHVNRLIMTITCDW